MLVLKELYRHTSGRIRAYGQLSPPFVDSSGVRQDCTISQFIFEFVIEDVLRNVLLGLLNGGVELLQWNRGFNLKYADDIILRTCNAQSAQYALSRLVIEVSKYGNFKVKLTSSRLAGACGSVHPL